MYENLGKIQQSYSVAFADYVREREAQGRKLVKMQTGDPDFATHPHIIRAAAEAMAQGQTRYCDSRGLVPLREALARKLSRKNGITASPARNILVTHGAVHGIGMAIRALVGPGDEVIIHEPFWRAYQADVILAGGIPVVVKASSRSGFQLEPQRVLERITGRTRAILINTPNNPSGAVYRRAQLEELARGAAARGVHLISDEVYEGLVFDGRRHYSPAADPEVADWVVSAFSFSKTHAMTGWRIGYVAAPAALVDEMLKLSQFSVTSLSPFSQIGALAALQDPEVNAYAEQMRKGYEARRDMIARAAEGNWLERAMTRPEGTFYALVDVARFGMASLELAQRLVDLSGVAFTPGIAFGDGMDGYLRMCFATSDDNIGAAMEVLAGLDRAYDTIVPPSA
jgi:aspartate aminotransferase